MMIAFVFSKSEICICLDQQTNFVPCNKGGEWGQGTEFPLTVKTLGKKKENSGKVGQRKKGIIGKREKEWRKEAKWGKTNDRLDLTPTIFWQNWCIIIIHTNQTIWIFYHIMLIYSFSIYPMKQLAMHQYNLVTKRHALGSIHEVYDEIKKSYFSKWCITIHHVLGAWLELKYAFSKIDLNN